MPPVKLYLVRVSPPCRIVWLYMLQNNIDHELVDIATLDDTEGLSAGKDVGPHTDVLILVDEDTTVFEAPAILDYLGSKYTQHSGFGKTEAERWKCHSMLSWINSEAHRIIGYMYVYPQYFDKFQLETESANECLVESGIQQLTDLLNKLESRYLSKGPYLCGSALTMADTFLATTLIQVQWVDFKYSVWSKVTAWLDTVEQQPQWKTVHEAHAKFLNAVHTDT